MSQTSYTFVGGAAGDRTGFEVSSVGDFDGDGRDDFLIGALSGDGTAYLISAADLDDFAGASDGIINLDDVAGVGNSYQFGGGPTNPALNPPFGNLPAAEDHVSVSSAGDVDGDGLDDLIIGLPTAAGGGNFSGESFLVMAADLAGLDGDNDGVIELDDVAAAPGSYRLIGEIGDSSGWSVSSAGDVNGDGFDDLMIGAVTSNDGGGGSGASFLISAEDLLTIDGADGAVDGTIDLANVAGVGASYLFVGAEAVDWSGWTVSSAGDVDDDGLDDLLIGARLGDGEVVNSGTSYLVLAADLAAIDAENGSVDGIIDLGDVAGIGASYQFNGAGPVAQAAVVSSAGDVDGDGLDDLIIGAPANNITFPGASYLVMAADLAAIDAEDGSVDGIIDLGDVAGVGASYEFIGIEDGSYAGRSVSSAGDVDGDGLDDLIIGAPATFATLLGGSPEPGTSYLIMGADLAALDAASGAVDGVIHLEDVAATGSSYEFLGPIQSAHESNTGWSVSSAGDVDDDGFDDLLISAYSANGGVELGTGETYLISGADLAAADDDGGGLGQDGSIDLTDIFYDGVVEGTAGNDLIDTDYLADPQLDRIDQLDSPDQNNNDVVQAGGGDDTIVSSLGDDAIDGGIGNDTYLVGPTEVEVDVVVNNDGDGSSAKDGTGTDTFTSVETFVAEEGIDPSGTGENIDAITINAGTASDPSAEFTTLDISGIDTGAEEGLVAGTFDWVNGGIIAFGPTEALSYDDIIAGINDNTYWGGGTINITSGDESGQVGNISFENFETINFDVVCFARGTKIATASGEVAIEDLCEGDKVITMDNGLKPIRWIGSCKLDAISLALKPKLKPVRIRTGALGHGLPLEDLRVSPQHRVLVRSGVAERMFGQSEVLIAANKLLALDGFEVETETSSVEYFHMLFDCHEIVFSNGAPTESLFTGPEALKSVTPEGRAEIMALFPELFQSDYVASAARPIPEHGRRMRRLAERHNQNEKPLLQPET